MKTSMCIAAVLVTGSAASKVDNAAAAPKVEVDRNLGVKNEWRTWPKKIEGQRVGTEGEYEYEYEYEFADFCTRFSAADMRDTAGDEDEYEDLTPETKMKLGKQAKRACKSKEASKWLGCKWYQGDVDRSQWYEKNAAQFLDNNGAWWESGGYCAKKSDEFEQPQPNTECKHYLNDGWRSEIGLGGGDGAAPEGAPNPCCYLNKRACKGKGHLAKKWADDFSPNGQGPNKLCKFTKDKSMQNLTPDGKHFGLCAPKDLSDWVEP